MFKVNVSPTFTRTVRVQIPTDGGHRQETLKATFRVLNTDEVEGFDLATTEGTSAFLCAVIESLDDIADANGEQIPYNNEVRDQVLKMPYVRLALSREYFEAVAKARKGN